MSIRRGILAAALVAAMIAPVTSHAEPVNQNPFGLPSMQILSQPNGATPGKARFTIDTRTGVYQGTNPIFFGLRIMGSEDLEMTAFRLTKTTGGCIVSDFAGNNTADGWQGAPAFGASTPAGSLNGHMRMVGGFLKKELCGNLEIDLSFRARPLVAYYAAFYGTNAAPWHKNYGSPPWSALTTGGNYAHWWNLWGSFDTLGYSNACTNISGTSVSCG